MMIRSFYLIVTLVLIICSIACSHEAPEKKQDLTPRKGLVEQDLTRTDAIDTLVNAPNDTLSIVADTIR